MEPEATAEEVQKSGIGMVVLDHPLIQNQVVNNPNGSKKMPKVEVAEMRNIMEKLGMIIEKVM